MRKKLVVAAVAASLVLTACGGDNGSGANGDGEEVTLRMVESLTSPGRTALIRGLLDEFEEEHQNITVELVSPPTEQADGQIQQMLQSETGVDLLEVRDLTVGPFSNNGWLYDMEADLQDWDGLDELTDQTQSAMYDADGHVYFIPAGFYGLSLFYRTDLVGAAGFDSAPHSWADLVEQAAAIQDPSQNQYGYAFRGGQHSNGQLSAIMEAYNADQLDPDNAYMLQDGSTLFSSPESLEAVNTYIELYETGSPESSISWGYPEMVQGFTNGSTAFLLQDPEVIAVVEESSLTEDQWMVAPNPVGPTGKAAWPMATAGWGVTEFSDHKDEAVELVKWLSEDASTEYAKGNSLTPILKSAAEDEHFRTGPWAAYVEMTSQPESYIPVQEPRGVAWWTEWTQMSQADFQQVLLGDMEPEAMLEKWDQFWTEKWEG